MNKSWDLSELKVLVVEDDGDTRELLCTALESRGATVYEAEEILTAQEWVRSHKLDVIVTDLMLPVATARRF